VERTYTLVKICLAANCESAQLKMSKYVTFHNESERRNLKLPKFLALGKTKKANDRLVITKMCKSYINRHPLTFQNKTRAVCKNSDLTMFLDQCKVLFVGDSKCGKTSLIDRFMTSSFTNNYKANSTAEFKIECFNILQNKFCLSFWDVPGHEVFKFNTQSCFKNANAIVAVFDLTRPPTLITARKLLANYTRVANSESDTIRYLVGTKSDINLDLEAEAVLVAQELDCEYISVSSKHGTEINNMFKRLAALAFECRVLKLITPLDYHNVKNNLSGKCKTKDFFISSFCFFSFLFVSLNRVGSFSRKQRASSPRKTMEMDKRWMSSIKR
jgi:small GTP-binding protein